MLQQVLWSILVWGVVFVPTEWVMVPTHHLDEPANTQRLPVTVWRTVPRPVDNELGPILQAKSAIVLDVTSGMVLWQKEPDEVLPMASLTKLMTAYVAQQQIDDWTTNQADLLKSALIGSINDAAVQLSQSTNLSEDEFITTMNDQAKVLGMVNTHYQDPTGLSEQSVSTSRELSLLFRTIIHDQFLLQPMTQSEHRMVVNNHEVIVKSTNQFLLNHAPHMVAGKTGFTYEAGGCLATLAENDAGNQIIVILLGATDETARFNETEQLVNWTFDHYNWP
ncbi:MAG: hypothetical protein WCV88_01465 [Patescibacteria group bacterium]|jgi:D-alanyl-D-alanine carboxypeptidase